VGLRHALAGCGVVAERLADARGAGQQLASAIWAAALEAGFGTVAAEGAFERTDQRVRAVARKINVAAFTIGAQFEHERLLGQGR